MAFRFCIAILLVLTLEIQAKVNVVTDWVVPLRAAGTPFEVPRERTRPVILGDMLFIASLAGEAFALHREESYPYWKTRLTSGVEAAFNQGRSKLIVGDKTGHLRALHTRDGSLAWEVFRPIQWLSIPEITRGKVIVTTSADEVLALHENTGEILWQYNGRGDEKMTVRGNSSPTVYNGNVYVGFSTGKVVSLSLADGTMHWEKTIPRRVQARFYDVDVKPYVDDKSVIVSNYEGKTASYKAKTGDLEWSFPVGSYGGYLIEEERIYFAGTNGHFYALDRSSGQPAWSIQYEEGVGSLPVRVGDYVVFVASGDPVYILDAKTGKVEGTYRLGAGSLAAPASTGDDTFYCLSNYGNLYGFRLLKNNPLREVVERVPVLSALNRFGEPRSDSEIR